MKRLHRPDLFGWTQFDEARDIDFHSVLWARPGGGVIIDPLPLSRHDLKHLRQLGGVRHIVVTNSDHARVAEALAIETGAELLGPDAERASFPMECDRWLRDGDEVVPGLTALALEGSKTPGELALLLERATLITGDLVRAHAGGRLDLLPDPKLADRAAALSSLARLAALPDVEAVLVGDGWPAFQGGAALLRALLARERAREGAATAQTQG
jgi:hypothetical protein